MNLDAGSWSGMTMQIAIQCEYNTGGGAVGAPPLYCIHP